MFITSPLFFHNFFSLSGLLLAVLPYFLTLWYWQGPVPPLILCLIVRCNPCTFLLLLLCSFYLSLSWLLFTWISHPQLSFVYNAWITFHFIQCWWIICHISFHQNSPWGDQHMSLHFLLWVLCCYSHAPLFLYLLLLLINCLCLMVYIGHLCQFDIFLCLFFPCFCVCCP